MNRRKAILGGLFAASLLAAAVWAYGYMADARQRAIEAREGFVDCQKMAAQIEGYSQRPLLAAEREEQSAQTTALIEKAAKSAGITPKMLTHITPELPQRIGDSPYKEKPTAVRVENVSMQALVSMLHQLSSGPMPLTPKSLRLAVPRGDEATSGWTAEAVLTYMIYEPQKAKE